MEIILFCRLQIYNKDYMKTTKTLSFLIYKYPAGPTCRVIPNVCSKKNKQSPQITTQKSESFAMGKDRDRRDRDRDRDKGGRRRSRDRERDAGGRRDKDQSSRKRSRSRERSKRYVLVSGTFLRRKRKLVYISISDPAIVTRTSVRILQAAVTPQL